MNKTRSFGLSLCALALSGAALSGAVHAALPPIADRGLRFMPYEVVVKFRDNLPPATLDPSLGEVVFNLQYGDFHIAKIRFRAPMKSDPASVREATQALLDALQARKDVIYAQRNYVLEFAMTPNDPLYPQQWHYPAIGLQNAWDITTGNSAVRIAIVDTGRSGHPDIAWSPLEYNAPQLFQPATDNGNWRHGTHVAAIAGARGNNGIGGTGVCFGCTLMNVKIGDTVTAQDPNPNWPTMAWAANSIRWSTDNGARVVNMSFGAGDKCQAFPLLLDVAGYAKDRGVSLVAAAGNEAGSVDGFSPASCPGVISVAATDRGNRLAAYSNRGANIGIAAPGGGGASDDVRFSANGQGIDCPKDPNSYFSSLTDGVLSAWTTSPISGNAHCYRYLSGTSMAAPHVSGAIGLMLSVKPSLRPSQIKQLLAGSATAMPECGTDCGPGRLNAYAAVLAAISATTGPCSAANDDGNKSLNCSIDTVDRYIDPTSFQSIESVTAYGYLWQFDANGSQIGTARPLRSIPHYAAGPCQFAPAGEPCRFDSHSIIRDVRSHSTYERVTAYGRIWNFNAIGVPSADSGSLLSSFPLYSGPCATTTGAGCRFDTLSLVESSIFGEVIEYVTANQQYWIYDGLRLLKTGMLLQEPKYRDGPCYGMRTCVFESQEFFADANGDNRREIVTAYGRYYEWDAYGNPAPSNGMSLRDIPRLR